MNQHESKQPTSSAIWLNRVEILFKFILILGSCGAAYQYYDIKQENRIKQTMEQSKVYTSERLQQARLEVITTWGDTNNYANALKYINKQTVESEEARMIILSKIVEPIMAKNDALKQDLRLLVEFFENLQVCMKYQICDKQVAGDFFCEEAKRLYDFHLPWIELQRIAYSSYGKKLILLLKSECNLQIG